MPLQDSAREVEREKDREREDESDDKSDNDDANCMGDSMYEVNDPTDDETYDDDDDVIERDDDVGGSEVARQLDEALQQTSLNERLLLTLQQQADFEAARGLAASQLATI